MSFCSFAEGAGMYDVTPIENMFLLEYLPEVTGPNLRVYLYARMVCLHPALGDSLEDMAKALHLETSDVEDAMDYWERQGLAMRMSDRPPTYAILPMRSGAAVTNTLEGHFYEFQKLHGRLRARFPESELHAKQFTMVEDWIRILKMEEDAVVRMVEAEVSRSRAKKPDPYKIFAKANENAARWADKYPGKTITVEVVELELINDEQVKRTVSAVMKQLSLDFRKASVAEMKLVDCWLNEWKFSHEEIIGACGETTKSRTPTMAYLNSILDSRRRGDGERFEGLKAALRELGITETPTPAQIEQYGKLLAAGFEPETVCLAAAQCSRKRKHRFEDLEWMLEEWAKQGLFRADQAQAYLQRMKLVKAEIRRLLKVCGSDSRPGMGDIEYYEKWTQAFSEDVITYASECAPRMRMPIRYMDQLLIAWEKEGVRTLDEARAKHEARKTTPAAAVAAPGYEQRSSEETNYGNTYIDLLGEYSDGGNKA